MDARFTYRGLIVCLALAGCSSTSASNGGAWPWSGATATGAATSTDGVVQASYEQTLAANGIEEEGISLSELPPPRDGDAWVRRRLDPRYTVRSVQNSVGLGPDESIANQLYAEGEELFRQKQYAEAASKFKSAAARWPDSLLEEDAMFMHAESLFFSDQYSRASDVYKQLLGKYENSRHLDNISAREFEIGRYWEEDGRKRWMIVPNFVDRKRPLFDTYGNGLGEFESIRLNDPTGPLADDAVMATANARFLQGRYEEASYQYDVLRRDYPHSDHQVQAHLLGIQSKLRAYQGPQYDATMLIEADELIDNTLRQFGSVLGEDRARLEELKSRTRAMRAERDFVSGEYYMRRGANRAAAYYFRQVLTHYADTPLAELSRQRLDSLVGLPPDPPDYFAWLKTMLGENEEE